MSDPIKLQITEIGLQSALDAQLSGIVVKLDKIKFSTDLFESVANDPHTDLANVVHESLIVAGGTSASQNTLRFSTMVNANAEYSIGSIGLYTDDDVLFAIASVETGYLMKLIPKVSFVMAFGMRLSTYLLENISVVIDSESALAVAMMFNHENHENPHPQYSTSLDTLALAEAVEAKFGLYATIALLNLTVDNSVDFLTSLLNAHKNAGNPHPQYLSASTFGVNMLMDASVATEIVDTNRVFGWDGESGDTFCFDKSVRWWNYHDQEVTFKPFRAYGKFLLSIGCRPEGDGNLAIKIFNKNDVLLSDTLIWNESSTSYDQVVKHLFALEAGGYAKIRLWGRPWNDSYAGYKGSIYVNDRVRRFVPVGYQSLVDAFNSSQDDSIDIETPIDYSDFSSSEWSRFDSGLNDNVGLLSGTTFASPESTVPHYHRALFAGNADTDLWIAIEVGTQLVQSPSDYAAVGSVVIRGTTDEDGNIVITIPLSMRSIVTPNDETLVYQVAYYTTAVTKSVSDPFPAGSIDGVHEFFTNPS